jgi:hypothetical protein
MIAFIDRIKDYLSEPVFPPAVFHLTRTCLSGIHYSKKEKKVTAHFILPLMTGLLEPSFDKKNIQNAAALEKTLREGKAKLGQDSSAVTLLIPEICLRVFVLTFDSLPSSPAEREEILRWRLNKLVPFKSADMRISYDVLKSNGRVKVLLALARVDVVREYENLFSRLGLKVRTIGVPLLNLVGLVRFEKPGHAMIVNIEEDYVSLLAVLDGEVSLYRFKPFLQDSQNPMSPLQKMDQVVNEIENTVHFIEDHEKKKIGVVWVRAAVQRLDGGTASALKERLPSLQVAEFSAPLPLKSQDQQLLAPLIGQVL